MALVSPGVEVTIIDQSQYLPAPTNSIPFVLVATAQDKADPNGVGVAQATTAANAGRLYEVTSQRDLVTLYGTPFFYQTSAGTPIQGYELNEYGLLAAYSLLGVTNRCYVLRADVDLASLVGQTGRPSSNPDDGTYWLDSTNTTWGINEWNAVTGKFTAQTPIVITDADNLSSNLPLESIGNIGDYAINALDLNALAPTQQGQYFYKTTDNAWVILGSDAWASDIPTVQGSNSDPTLDANDTFTINLDGDVTFTITIPSSPNNTVTGVAAAINTLGYGYLSAEVRDGRLCIFLTYPESGTPRYITLAEGTNTPLADMGITPGTYYRPIIQWGTSSQQPLWQTGQTYPRPTGSVWLKASGSGLSPVVAEWDSTLASFVTKNVSLATSDAAVIATLDATGGKAIAAGSVYGQYGFNNSYAQSPVYLWERFATGPTVVTGTAESPEFGASFTTGTIVVGRTYTIVSGSAWTSCGAADNNPGTVFVASSTFSSPASGVARPVYELSVQVTEPGTANLSSSYSVNFTGAGATTATAFVTAWLAAGIPYTSASVTTDGTIQLTHTEGGSIILNDTITTGVGKGLSSALLSLAGFVAGSTDGVKRYNGSTLTFTGVATDITRSDTETLSNVQITGTAGEFSCDAASLTLKVGTAITVSGTNTGTGAITGYTTPTTYFITVTNGSTTFTLSATRGGSAITTTAGSTTGLTFSSKVAGDLTVSVTKNPFGYYLVNPTSFGNAGFGYELGDTVTVLGTALAGSTTANDLVLEITGVTDTGGPPATTIGVVTSVQFVSGTPNASYSVELSNWREFDYTANEGAPVQAPANNTNWFYSEVDQVDILVNYNGAWRGYGNQGYDSNGFPTPGVSNATDPNGPIVSASAPTTQSDGSALVHGDLWIDTSDLENYPVINRWQSVDGLNQWVLIDNTDQTNPTGVLFADARWSSSGAINPYEDPIPTIKSLLTSDYVDLDIPSDSLYPTGMLLFNTRRSGYNVKQFRTNYFTSANYPEAGAYDAGDPTNINNLPSSSSTWVTASGLQANGAPYMGRKAQRAMVVEAMRATIDTNVTIRDEDVAFNLLATPNYPELQPNMVVLNADRGETGYIIGDTPMGLADSATAISAWANNTAGATSTGEEGLVTRNTYLGLFYPSGIASDLSGNLVAVPASHMMLRTFLRNDAIAYPWFAAAGTRRGLIDNAANIGYVNRTTGEFQVVRTSLGIRDTLYTNFINPLVFFTGNGLLNYGNKTSFNSSSALDRTNVARLVAYLKRQLTLAARPFIFEPNDSLTRSQITGVITTLLLDIQSKRGIYDYLVVCDQSNNTPARIDRNELWVDVAIEPVKAVEFIYIPVRILNTGEISG